MHCRTSTVNGEETGQHTYRHRRGSWGLAGQDPPDLDQGEGKGRAGRGNGRQTRTPQVCWQIHALDNREVLINDIESFANKYNNRHSINKELKCLLLLPRNCAATQEISELATHYITNTHMTACTVQIKILHDNSRGKFTKNTVPHFEIKVKCVSYWAKVIFNIYWK